MMKRTLILVAVLALALGVSASAFIFQADGRPASGIGGGQIQFGDANASVGSYIPPLGEYAAFALIGDADALLIKQFTGQPAPAEGFQAVLWATPGFAEATANIRFWVQQLGNGTTTGSVVTGQEWEILGPGGGQLWKGVLSATGTATSPAITLPGLPLVKTANGLQGAIYTFRPASVIPEPGSMLALGSGLIGLIGFGIRRRK